MKHAIISLALFGALLQGQPNVPLSRVAIPQPVGAEAYIADKDALVALGKALFWDMQAGSDNQTACATCHFHAGADHRLKNQMTGAVNQSLAASQFPLHSLANPADNRSAVLRDSAAVVGSAGVFQRTFNSVGAPSDDGIDAVTAFHLNGVHARQVTGRNTPSVINSVYNVRNFWDGRASSTFSGLTPFGTSDTRPNALVWANDRLEAATVRVTNASLASQAVGPPLSGVEMSYAGRTWPMLGKRLLALRPLALQQVASDDSVLGALADGTTGRGLAYQSYLNLVQAAFQPQYWSAPTRLDSSGAAAESGEFSQAEFNFALFFGLAVQAYETTLVSGETPFDLFAAGDTNALTAQQRQGLAVFQRSECGTCHSGAEFTAASFSARNIGGGGRGGAGGPNGGFFRTGVRPAAEDIGLAAKDDFGQPLAVGNGNVTGFFKTPGLRNIEFTGPYFHNGGVSTLEQVVEFYNRGSDFPQGGVGPDIRNRNLSASDQAALVAFMKALTDDRVKFERAPFDHPELCVPVGQVEIAPGVLAVDGSDPRFALSAMDTWAGIPANGRGGNAVPLQTFEEQLAGIGNDGTRANHLTGACSIPGLGASTKQ